MEEKSNPNRMRHKPRKKGKTFNWCILHKAWCMHKPSEFHLGMPKANAQTSSTEAVNDNYKATVTLANL